MKTQQAEIEAMLAAEGWRIVSREAPSASRIDEVWTIESEWRPVGQRLYVRFLVDPMAPMPRPKGEHVWAVDIVAEPGWAATCIPLRPRWQRVHREELMALIRRLRE